MEKWSLAMKTLVLTVAIMWLSASLAHATPVLEIVVYDGSTGQIAGCSEPDCLGGAGPGTGTVTARHNPVAYGFGGCQATRVILYVDGVRVDAVLVKNGGPTKPTNDLMDWDAQKFAAGPQAVQGALVCADQPTGYSTPMSIMVVK